jgi:DNA-binding MarR family transcriptional regulator
MHGSTHALGEALIELVGLMNDPRRDRRLLAEAGLDLDPLLLPLLVRIGVWGPAGAVELAAHLGRDHSTVSRQLARLEAAGLLARQPARRDRRLRPARLTERGERSFAALAAARTRLLNGALADWPPADRAAFNGLFRRFIDALKSAADIPPGRQMAASR